jgi:peptide/nickel transport system substrate-binding protein
VLTEGSDVRVKNDIPLEITLLADRDPVRDALAERVAEDLRDVGIGVTVELEDSSTLITDSLIPRDYQAAIFGWDQGLDPDPYPAWHSSQAGGNGRNLAEYQSEDADALMEDGRRTFDLDQRQSLYYSFQEVFNLDVPSVILYYPVYNYFVRETVEGVDLGTLFYTGSRFRNVHEWTLDSAAQVVVD